MVIGDGLASPDQAPHRYLEQGVTVGFFTDPTVCIGCKACEVACKEWNGVPADGYLWTGESYDNTGALSASTWRHVKFLELDGPLALSSLASPPGGPPGTESGVDEAPPAWLFLSDVCKHCHNAGCLECCPTGAIVRTGVGSVLVQDDVCNGCGYCAVGCPFGVIDRRARPLPGAGGAFKCTFCYDRQVDGLTPACAKACPTGSILFGPLDELRRRAGDRLEEVRRAGQPGARLYDPTETSVGGLHAFFLLLGEPESFGLPPRPEVPTIHLRHAWWSAAATAALSLAGTLLAFALR